MNMDPAWGNLQSLMGLLSGVANSFPGPTGADPFNPQAGLPVAPAAPPPAAPSAPMPAPVGPRDPAAWGSNTPGSGPSGYRAMHNTSGPPMSLPTGSRAMAGPPIDDTGGAGGVPPGGVETLAQKMAATGSSPPARPLSLGPNMPALGTPSATTGMSYGPRPGVPSPMPRDPWAGLRESNVRPAATASAPGTQPRQPSGVKAPPAPEPQRVSTPAAPRPSAAIDGGNIAALLARMYGQPAARAPYQLPPTLGLALAGRR